MIYQNLFLLLSSLYAKSITVNMNETIQGDVYTDKNELHGKTRYFLLFLNLHFTVVSTEGLTATSAVAFGLT